MDVATTHPAHASHALERVLPEVARRTLPHAVEAMPGVECGGPFSHRLEPRGGIHQVVDVVHRATEVLGGEAHTGLAREHARAVAAHFVALRGPSAAPFSALTA